jgi:hypothetical protein
MGGESRWGSRRERRRRRRRARRQRRRGRACALSATSAPSARSRCRIVVSTAHHRAAPRSPPDPSNPSRTASPPRLAQPCSSPPLLPARLPPVIVVARRSPTVQARPHLLGENVARRLVVVRRGSVADLDGARGAGEGAGCLAEHGGRVGCARDREWLGGRIELRPLRWGRSLGSCHVGGDSDVADSHSRHPTLCDVGHLDTQLPDFDFLHRHAPIAR